MPKQRADIHNSVTIVLLTYNCAAHLSQTLEHLCALPGNPPIIAVDNHSTDETLRILHEREPRISVIALPRNIGAAARNEGVKQARTPYVAFADDDTWWADGALQRVAAAFDAHPRLTLINAKILVGSENKPDAICEEMANSPLPSGALPGHKIVSFMGGASAVRKAAFLTAGGYEPRLFLGGEEELLATDIMVQGGELRYLPGIIVHHHPNGNSVDALRWYGVRNALWFVWRRRSAPSAWRWTRYIYQTSRPLTFLRGLAGFFRGLVWALYTRRPVPASIERELQLLDKQRLGSSTRSYGD